MTILLVALGGAIGSVMRYQVSQWFNSGDDWVATLLVNITGAFLIGVVAVATDGGDYVGGPGRAGLIAGLLGGFTTFSALAYQAHGQLEAGDLTLAGVNLALSLALGLGAVWLGTSLGRQL